MVVVVVVVVGVVVDVGPRPNSVLCTDAVQSFCRLRDFRTRFRLIDALNPKRKKIKNKNTNRTGHAGSGGAGTRADGTNYR